MRMRMRCGTLSLKPFLVSSPCSIPLGLCRTLSALYMRPYMPYYLATNHQIKFIISAIGLPCNREVEGCIPFSCALLQTEAGHKY